MRTEVVFTANLQLLGFEDLDAAFNRISTIPASVTEDALSAMAAVAAAKIRSTGESMGVRDPESDVHILDKIKMQKPKLASGGGYAEVNFSGTRTRKRTRTRNAEIAFVNEYGKRGQPARPFIGTAMERYAGAIAKPGEEIIGDWIEKEWKK